MPSISMISSLPTNARFSGFEHFFFAAPSRVISGVGQVEIKSGGKSGFFGGGGKPMVSSEVALSIHLFGVAHTADVVSWARLIRIPASQ